MLGRVAFDVLEQLAELELGAASRAGVAAGVT
jgi:hypothetical protein